MARYSLAALPYVNHWACSVEFIEGVVVTRQCAASLERSQQQLRRSGVGHGSGEGDHVAVRVAVRFGPIGIRPRS